MYNIAVSDATPYGSMTVNAYTVGGPIAATPTTQFSFAGNSFANFSANLGINTIDYNEFITPPLATNVDFYTIWGLNSHRQFNYAPVAYWHPFKTNSLMFQHSPFFTWDAAVGAGGQGLNNGGATATQTV